MTLFAIEGDNIFKTSFTAVQKFATFEIITKENPTALPLLSLRKGMLAFPVDYEFNGMFSDQIFQNKGSRLQGTCVSLRGSPCCKWPEISQGYEDRY